MIHYVDFEYFQKKQNNHYYVVVFYLDFLQMHIFFENNIVELMDMNYYYYHME